MQPRIRLSVGPARSTATGLIPLQTAGELHRLPFELLPETVAVQRVTGDSRAHHRHQRQLLTQTQLARQTGFIEQFQRAVGHLGGIAELQQLTVGMDANG